MKKQDAGSGQSKKLQKWKIRSRRDWVIAFLFATLICYGILGRFVRQIDRMLLYVTNPRLSDLNQPSGYGNVAVTALLMGTIAAVVFLVKKRSIKYALIFFLTGFGIAAVSIGGYFFHCGLLVHVPLEEEPVSISVQRGWSNGESVGYGAYDQTDKAKEIVRLCTALEELPRNLQRQAQEAYQESRSENGEAEIRIWIQYPEKYLHSYALLLCMENGQVFARRDGGANLVFFADNGLCQAAEGILTSGRETE